MLGSAAIVVAVTAAGQPHPVPAVPAMLDGAQLKPGISGFESDATKLAHPFTEMGWDWWLIWPALTGQAKSWCDYIGIASRELVGVVRPDSARVPFPQISSSNDANPGECFLLVSGLCSSYSADTTKLAPPQSGPSADPGTDQDTHLAPGPGQSWLGHRRIQVSWSGSGTGSPPPPSGRSSPERDSIQLRAEPDRHGDNSSPPKPKGSSRATSSPSTPSRCTGSMCWSSSSTAPGGCTSPA